MASGQTANFGLNQWTTEDKVLRKEFNRDNAKLDTELKTFGNCQIIAGSYVGNGHYNTSGTSTLTFSGKPIAVFIYNGTCLFAFSGNTTGQVLTNGAGWTVSLIWTGNKLSWYSQNSAAQQLNVQGTTYHYFALIDAVNNAS